MKIAIVGGGISGLSAAVRLQDLAAKSKVNPEIVLYESRGRLGGVVESVLRDGAIMECGPDSVYYEDPWMSSFLNRLGIESDIIRPNLNHSHSLIYVQGEFLPMLEKLKFMAVADIMPLLWNAKSPEDYQGVKYSHFISFRQGMETLVRKMAEQISGVSVRLNSRVQKISRDGASFLISGEDFESPADAVCSAATAKIAGRYLEPLNPALGGLLAKIPARRCATVNLVYRTASVGRIPNGMSFAIPLEENLRISGAVFSSVKFSGRTPAGETLVRVFVSEKTFPDMFGASEKDLLDLAVDEIAPILRITEDPLNHWVSLFTESLPDYQAGHSETIKKVEAEVLKISGLVLAGNYLNGAGLLSCIKSGEAAADKIFNSFL